MPPSGIVELPPIVAEQTSEVTQMMDLEDFSLRGTSASKDSTQPKELQGQDVVLIAGRPQRSFKPCELPVTLIIIVYVHKTLKLALIISVES